MPKSLKVKLQKSDGRQNDIDNYRVAVHKIIHNNISEQLFDNRLFTLSKS